MEAAPCGCRSAWDTSTDTSCFRRIDKRGRASGDRVTSAYRRIEPWMSIAAAVDAVMIPHARRGARAQLLRTCVVQHRGASRPEQPEARFRCWFFIHRPRRTCVPRAATPSWPRSSRSGRPTECRSCRRSPGLPGGTFRRDRCRSRRTGTGSQYGASKRASPG